MTILKPFLDERSRWFLWLPVLLTVGIGTHFVLDKEPPSYLLLLSPLFVFLAFLLRQHVLLQPLVAVFLTIALGFNAAQLEAHLAAAPMLSTQMKPTSITGRLMHVEVLPQKKTRLTVKDPVIRGLTKDQTPLYLRIKTKKSLEELPEPGEWINVWGPLWPPGERVAPRAYDFRRNSYFKQLGGTAVAYAGPRVRQGQDPPFFWDGFYLIFERARQKLLATSYQHLSGPEADMTGTLLSGSQSSIDPDVMKAMRASGLSHLLSISGIHVSMFALLVYIPLRYILALFPFVALRFSTKKIAAVLAILSTSLYVLLVGPETPTVRSALMTAIVLFAVIADRKAMSMRLVALASMPILLLAPSAVIGPSFQMSFAAVLAMVAAYEKKLDHAIKEGASYELPRWLKRIGKSGGDIILTSLIATAATTPFALFHFQSFSFYGVAANIIALPLTSFWIMPNLLLTYLTMPFGFEEIFLRGAGWGVHIIIEVAHEIASWPYARSDMPLMPFTAFFLAVGGGLWLCLWQKTWRYLGLLPIIAACFYPYYSQTPDMFVSAEKGVWALRQDDHTLLVYGKKHMDFLSYQWRQLANVKYVQFMPNNAIHQINVNGVHVAYLPTKTRNAAIEKICQTNKVVISPLALEKCAASYVIDKAALQNKGGHSLYFDNGTVTIETVRLPNQNRPWMVR